MPSAITENAMGHSESYYFVDPREGEYGIAYHRSSREEAEQLAMTVGYLGAIQVQIKAYPPKAVTDVPTQRVDRSNDPIPF
jgi:hypothetical protein